MKRFLLLAAAASLLTGGCGAQVTGTATTSAPSSARLPSDGAPAVTDPIAATASVEADPCSAIPTAEIEAIGGKVKNSRLDDLTMGNNCVWVFQESPNTVSAGLVTGNKDGLSALYAQNATSGLTTFKPVDPINGYPAVIFANGGEGEGNCTLAVGVRDDLVYTVIPRLTDHHPSFSDPCGMATKVAAAAINHIKKP
ncbi:DUF3558 domain-containing protein [Amycolatopsis sp. WAC 01416]|uniref:DUF3558 domain-containing protein n=1 Tax=Amycolatopsis sp. WAC 01416 TaxID=2203196 RepID=UPI000F7B36A3|nr:DUF3558 domain-containing protein [Amycolatopsis sp. WAC 01416]RSN37883.1 DUF3558 domain-containing protein [Amycolatopsis sp. WAC 01416]